MASIYDDSKTFVDMKMRYPTNETLAIFENFMEVNKNRPKKKQLKSFVSKTFEPAGQEFEEWVPTDWVEYPKYLNKVKDPELRKWGVALNSIWKELGRKMKDEIKDNQELYSIIWVPNPVIVPGGRFREFYYWDSYWIIQGLLLSEMYTTVKGKLSNFLYIVENYGHVPNGGRVYYLQRSQPPLLIPMVKLYLDATNDINFISGSTIQTLEKEFDYWVIKHTRNVLYYGKNYTLAFYEDFSKGPRPESYSEDVKTARVFEQEDQKQALYSELKAAAESGWDFSSRWFINKGTNIVDLNAVLCWNAALLAEFNLRLNNKDKVDKYTKISKDWLEAVTAVLWHEEVGAWLDYDLINSVKRNYFYVSNIAPLWTGCYKKENSKQIVGSVLKYLERMKVVYPGGVPTSKEFTGEQWDFPNAWPPLQHIMITGLSNTGDKAAQSLAFKLTDIWTRANYKAYYKTKAMYEKYDATVPGGYGGGGEYELQFGFGWTNGVIMDLLNRYGNVLTYSTSGVMATTTYGQVVTALLALIVLLKYT